MAFTPQKEQCFDIVQNLKLAATPVTGIEDLIPSARSAFQILEPWSQATTSSPSPFIQDIIIDMKKQARLYFDAIDMSIETSRDGVTFAEDAKALCEFLLQEQPADHLIAFIQDLQGIARNAHAKARATLEKFKSVRTGLLELTGRIPWIVEKIFDEYRSIEASKRRNQWAGDGATLLGTFATGTGGTILTFANSTIPHLSIILPVLLPLLVIIAEKIGDRCRSNIEVRRREEISCKEALAKLEAVDGDIQELLKHTNVFAKWWHNIDTELCNVKAAVEKIRYPRLDPLRVATVQQSWANIANKHLVYISEISKLQDFYPTDLSDRQLRIPVVPPPFSPQNKLAGTLKSLTQHVVDCQIAFNKLRVASSYVKDKYFVSLREQLEDIRICLKTEWEALQHLLSQILVLDKEIAIDDDDHTAKDSAGEIYKMAQALLNLHTDTHEKFIAHEKSISKLLRSKLKSRRRNVRRIKDLISMIKTISEPSSGDESDRGSKSAFLENALASVHPDGPKALISLERAISDNGSSIEDLSHCLNRALSNLTRWHVDREPVNTAIMLISASSDSLTTEPPEHPAKSPHSRSHQRVSKKL